MFKKLVLILIVLSFFVTSCGPRVPAVQETGYERETISENKLPRPIKTIPSEETIQTEWGEETAIAQTSASQLSNKEGLVVYEDTKINVLVPVKIVDEDGKPVPRANVVYISDGNNISIVVTDPSKRYQPKIVNLTRNELFSTASNEPLQIVQSMFGTTTVHAAPPGAVGTVAAIVIGLYVVTKVVDSVLLAGSVQEVRLTRDQVVGYADSYEYICRHPDYFSSRAGMTTDLMLLVFSPDPTGVGKKVVKTWADMALSAIVEELAGEFSKAETNGEPILFRQYNYSSQKEMQLVYGPMEFDPEQEYEIFEVIEPVEIGTEYCAFVPNLRYMQVYDAKKALSEAGISSKFYEFSCWEGEVECDNQYVASQKPEVKESMLKTQIPMIPLYTENGLVLTKVFVEAQPSLEDLQAEYGEEAESDDTFASASSYDYSDLNSFKQALKIAVEYEDYDLLEELTDTELMISFDSGDFADGNFYFRGEFIDLVSDGRMSEATVDLGANFDLGAHLKRSGPGMLPGEIVSYGWRSAPGFDWEPLITVLIASQHDNRYWLTAVHQFPESWVAQSNSQDSDGWELSMFLGTVHDDLKRENLPGFESKLHDPLYIHQITNAGGAIGPIAKTPMDGFALLGVLMDIHDLSNLEIEILENDVSSFYQKPSLAEHTIFVYVDYGFRLGIGKVGGKYYITDMFWELQ